MAHISQLFYILWQILVVLEVELYNHVRKKKQNIAVQIHVDWVKGADQVSQHLEEIGTLTNALTYIFSAV